MKIDVAAAFAWEFSAVGDEKTWLLCCWAEPTETELRVENIKRRPGAEARICRVRILRETDYRKLLKAARGKK